MIYESPWTTGLNAWPFQTLDQTRRNLLRCHEPQDLPSWHFWVALLRGSHRRNADQTFKDFDPLTSSWGHAWKFAAETYESLLEGEPTA